MILVDVNILVYASITTFSEHDVAHEWLDRQINGTGKVGLPWSSLIGFLRVVTNPRIFNRPFSMTLAWGQVNAWLECDTVWTPEPAIPLADPVGLLEAGTVESRFLHTRRSEFLASIAAQRSAAQGLAGVWSAAIELQGRP